MGQRHQLFVIAKIIGRYRGLAAIHHQWLYGSQAVKVCRNLLGIFKSPANRWALKHELRWAANHLTDEDWSHDSDDRLTDKSAVPFPFILTSLAVGASLRPAEAYHAFVHALPFNLSFDGGDNNDGITVIDITDLDNPRYCFVNFSTMYGDEEDSGERPLMTPLSGSEYSAAYDDLDASLEGPEPVPLVDGRALNSVWPDEMWNAQILDGETESVWCRVKDLSTEETSVEQLGLAIEEMKLTTKEQPTLRSSTLAKTIKSLFESPVSELDMFLERASLLTDFYPAVKKQIYAEPAIATRSLSARRLLSTALKDEGSIDLSPFFELMPDQIMEVLEERSRSPEGLTILNISGNQNLTEKTLENIVESFPDLQTLRLLDAPQIPLTKKINLLQGTTIRVIDSEQFMLPFIAEYISRPRLTKWVPREKPLYGYIKPIVSQMLMVNCGYETMGKRDKEGGIDVDAVLRAPESMTAQSWSCIPLEEVNLGPTELLSGLIQYLGYLKHQRAYGTGFSDPVAVILANNFAMPMALDDSENSARIYPICEYLYNTPRDSWSLSKRGGYWKKPSRIVPGEWTLVLIGDGHREDAAVSSFNTRLDVRYAFVTTNSPTGTQQHPPSDGTSTLPALVIESIEGFLNLQTSLSAANRVSILKIWEKATAQSKIGQRETRMCGKLELESALRALLYTDTEIDTEID